MSYKSFDIERLILGSALHHVFHDKKARWLILDSIQKAINPLNYTNSASDRARKRGVPRRLQLAILMSTGYIAFLLFSLLVMALALLSVIDVKEHLAFISIGLAGFLRLIEEFVSPSEEDMSKSVKRLVVTSGVVDSHSVRMASTPENGEELPMPIYESLVGISLQSFREHLAKNSATLEEDTAKSIAATQDDFRNSHLAEKLEFNTTSGKRST